MRQGESKEKNEGQCEKDRKRVRGRVRKRARESEVHLLDSVLTLEPRALLVSLLCFLFRRRANRPQIEKERVRERVRERARQSSRKSSMEIVRERVRGRARESEGNEAHLLESVLQFEPRALLDWLLRSLYRRWADRPQIEKDIVGERVRDRAR